MSLLMKKELDNLKAELFAICKAAESSFKKAIESIQTRSATLAQEVIDSDIEIDKMEVGIEEHCLKILALYQPVAMDLRFIITVLKMNNDLERIGDLAVNIAERSVFLAKQEKIDIPFDFEVMAEKTGTMLRKSMDALINSDCKLAYTVCAADDEVDAINRTMYEQVKKGIQDHPNLIEVLIHMLSVSRALERIADHATNIAEDVIYMVVGKIIRHKAEDFK